MTDEEIHAYELQMLPSSTGRDYRDSPKTALSRAQQVIWGHEMEKCGRPIEAEFYLSEREVTVSRTGRAKPSKTVSARDAENKTAREAAFEFEGKD